jgi:uncharacterized membrane protein YphA (DoxX/SURF4 family)
MKTFDWILRLALAAVFAGAAVTKIADPAEFHAAIQTYRMLPEVLVAPLALWLPWVELCTAVALVWPRHRRAALWLIFALSIVFIVAIAQAWWRGLDIVCGCFGRPATVSGPAFREYLLRDFAFLAVAVWLLAREWFVARAPAKPPAP